MAQAPRTPSLVDLLRPSEAARLIGITAASMTHAMDRGNIEVVQIGTQRLIPRAAAEAYKRHRPPAGRPRKDEIPDERSFLRGV